MSPPKDLNETPAARRATRRFDFAEYTRQERLAKGDAEDVAKGYGIWPAKVVAARRFGTASPSADRPKSPAKELDPEEAPTFRSVGELKTDATFDHDIIDRMGVAFYDAVFVPAITAARAEGRSCEEIRDDVRRAWTPARRSSPKAVAYAVTDWSATAREPLAYDPVLAAAGRREPGSPGPVPWRRMHVDKTGGEEDATVAVVVECDRAGVRVDAWVGYPSRRATGPE